MIRKYIEESSGLVKAEADSRVIGNTISDYLSGIFMIYSRMIKSVFAKNKKITADQRSAVDDIITRGLIDYNEYKTPMQMMSALKRLEFDYKSKNEAKAQVSKLQYTVTVLGYIGTIASTIISMYKVVSMIYNRQKDIKVMTKTNAKSKRLFEYFIIPGLKDIYEDVASRKIKSETMLKVRFFKLIDKVSRVSPDVGSHLSSWGV